MKSTAFRQVKLPACFCIAKPTLAAMKFTFLLLTVACLQISARGLGQTIRLHLSGAPIETAFKVITQQTGYRFIYTQEDLQGSQPVRCDLDNVSLQTALDSCFSGQPLKYSIEERYVVVTRQVIKKLVIADTLIKGQIINEKEEPVAGVTIQAKSSGETVFSSSNGEFQLSKTNVGDQLLLTSVQLEPYTVTVTKTNFLLIHVQEKINILDETIVKGYYNTSRRLNTGTVDQLDQATISHQPIINPLSALEGRLPGLLITPSSGIPGSAIKVELRGRSSIAQGTDPLIVIDGVPYSPNNSTYNQLTSAVNLPGSTSLGGLSPLNSIDPSVIESIEVLKDADATAIYGSRGANGVILISTKKGKAGKPVISADLSNGFSVVSRRIEMLDTHQYLQMRHEAFVNDGISPTLSNAPDLLAWDTTRYTDFSKLLIGNKARQTQAHLSFSGGNSTTNFLMSAGYSDQTTVFPGDMHDSRTSFLLNFTHAPSSNRFRLTFTTQYSSDKNNLIISDLTSFLKLPPNTPPLFDNTGKLNWQENGASFDNPLAYLQRKYTAAAENLITNLVASIKLNSSLTFKTSVGINSFISDETSLSPQSSLDPANNPFGNANFAHGKKFTYLIEPQIEYNPVIKVGKINALLGGSWQKIGSEGNSIEATGYTNDLLLSSLGAATSFNASNQYSRYQYAALYARVGYNLFDKYLLNLTGRRDGSSRFGPGHRFSNFGAAGVAWVFSKENLFKKKFPFISYGKIRTSYGITGNDQIGDYKYLDSWTSTSNPYDGISGLRPTRLFNKDYSWELNRKWELSLDLGFWKDRLLLSATTFRNRSGNQLITYNLPLQTGFSNIAAKNFPALVQNTGWEFSIDAKIIGVTNFSWNSSIVLTIPQNKLISFPGIETSSYSTLVIGKPLNLIRGYHFISVNDTTGVYNFEDIDKDGKISSPNDIVKYLGSTDPKWYGGFNNTFHWKSWEASLFWEFRKQTGRSYLYSILSSVFTPGFSFNQPTEMLNRWTTMGENAMIQKFTASSSSDASKAISKAVSGDALLTDASYARLKNIYVSYTLHFKREKDKGIKTGRIYLQGQNLLLITPYKVADPVIQNIYVLPPLKTIAAGIQLTF